MLIWKRELESSSGWTQDGRRTQNEFLLHLSDPHTCTLLLPNFPYTYLRPAVDFKRMTSDLEVCVTRMAREESESDDDDDDDLQSNKSEDVGGDVDQLSGGSGLVRGRIRVSDRALNLSGGSAGRNSGRLVSTESSCPQVAIHYEAAKDVFQKFDKDSSGFIEGMDAKAVIQAWGIDLPNEDSLDQIISQHDLNNNGRLDLPEFLNLVAELTETRVFNNKGGDARATTLSLFQRSASGSVTSKRELMRRVTSADLAGMESNDGDGSTLTRGSISTTREGEVVGANRQPGCGGSCSIQ